MLVVDKVYWLHPKDGIGLWPAKYVRVMGEGGVVQEVYPADPLFQVLVPTEKIVRAAGYNAREAIRLMGTLGGMSMPDGAVVGFRSGPLYSGRVGEHSLFRDLFIVFHLVRTGARPDNGLKLVMSLKDREGYEVGRVQ